MVKKISGAQNIFCAFLMVLISSGLMGQEKRDTSYWKVSGQGTINMSQISFSNWIGGGKNSVSGVGLFNLNAAYEKGKVHWDNSLKTGYGLLKEEGSGVLKAEDRLELNSKLGIETGVEHLLYGSFVNFLTQFAHGYKYPNTTDKISTFFAPAYVTVAAGFDYVPSKKFSLFFTPLAGKFTFVMDDELSNAGAFGVSKGENLKSEMGATFKSEFKTPIVKNVDLTSTLALFSNYFHNPQNVDIAINMKINDYLSSNLLTNLVYDDDILIPLDNEGNKGKRVQMKQLFGVGLSYKF